MSVLARAEVVLEANTQRFKADFAAAAETVKSKGEQMTKLGREIGETLSLELGVLGGEAIHAAADFDTSMRKISAIVGLSGKDVAAFSDEVKEFAIQAGKSPKEAADALLVLTQRGLRGVEAMDALHSALKGSAVGLGETTALSKVAAAVTNSYGKENISAAKALDILAAANHHGAVSADEIESALGRALPAAAGLKVGFDQVAGILAVMSKGGLEGGRAMMSLNKIFTSLYAPSKKVTDVLGAENIARLKQIAATKGLVPALRELQHVLGGVDDSETLVTEDANTFRAMMSVLNHDASEVAATLKDTASANGEIDKAFAKTAAGAGLQLSQMWQSLYSDLEKFGVVLIPTVLPIFKELGEGASFITDKFKNLSPGVQSLIVYSAGLVVALGPALFALGKIMSVSSMLIPILGRVAFGVSGVGLSAKAMVPSLISGSETLRLWGMYSMDAVKGTVSFTAVLTTLKTSLISLATTLGPVLIQLYAFKKLGETFIVWQDAKAAVEQTTDAMKEAAKAQLQLFKASSPKEAAEETARLTARMRELSEKLAYANEEQKKDIRAQISSMGQTVAALAPLAASYHATTAAVKDHTDHLKAIPPWSKQATAALKKLTEDTRLLGVQQMALGPAFNFGEAQAHLLETTIQNLEEAGVGLDDVLDKNGTTIRTLSTDLAQARAQAIATTAATDAHKKAIEDVIAAVKKSETPFQRYVAQEQAARELYIDGSITLDQLNAALKEYKDELDNSNESLSRAKEAIKGALTPQQLYAQTVADLQEYLKKYPDQQDKVNAALAHAKEVLSGATEQTHELQQALIDMSSKGVDSLVDLAVTGKNNIRQFVQSAITDIAKLIVKMEIMRALFPSSKKGDSIFKDILGFAGGGYIPGGSLGLVGESGPELVMAGQHGMTVSPMRGSVMAAPSGGGDTHMHVHTTVVAPDQQTVTRFFEDHEDHVGAAMVRVYQKSSAVRKLLGGK